MVVFVSILGSLLIVLTSFVLGIILSHGKKLDAVIIKLETKLVDCDGRHNRIDDKFEALEKDTNRIEQRTEETHKDMCQKYEEIYAIVNR